MSDQTKYYEMVEGIHMPEDKREKLRAELSERSAGKNPVLAWRHYLAAAVLVLCLLGAGGTAFAAYHFQWFSIFFENAEEETDLLKKMAKLASTEPLVKETKDYKISILSNLYSKEQKMGLLVCSYQPRKGTLPLEVYSKDDDGSTNTWELTAEGAERQERVLDKERTNLCLLMMDENGAIEQSAASAHYSGQKADDGGFLVGVRYDFFGQKGEKEASLDSMQLGVFREQGDIVPLQGEAGVRLPETENLEAVKFVSQQNPENEILISPIGCVFKETVEKGSDLDKGFSEEAVDVVIKAFLQDQTVYIDDLTSFMTLTVSDQNEEGKRDSERLRYIEKNTFYKVVDVEKIKSMEVNGERFVNTVP